MENVTITALDECNQASVGTDVTFRGASVDGTWYNVGDIVSGENWKIDIASQTLTWYGQNQGRSISIQLPNGIKRSLIFNTGPDQGMVQVETNGQILRLDLYNESVVKLGREYELPILNTKKNERKSIILAGTIYILLQFLLFTIFRKFDMTVLCRERQRILGYLPRGILIIVILFVGYISYKVSIFYLSKSDALTKVTITSLGEKNRSSTGKGVTFRGALVDGIWYCPSDILLYGDWTEGGEVSTLSWNENIKTRSITVRLSYGTKRNLTFNVGPDQGIVQIGIGGKNKIIDLYNENTVDVGLQYELPEVETRRLEIMAIFVSAFIIFLLLIWFILSDYIVDSSLIHRSKFENGYFLLISILGTCILLLISLNFGAGVSVDSVGYISGAKSLVDGKMFSNYGTQPPLFPAIIAIVGVLFKIDPFEAARYLNSVIFGLNIFLSGVLLRRYTKIGTGPILLQLVFFMVSYPLYYVSLMVWTETLFICLTLVNLLLFSYVLEHENFISFLLLSISIAFTILTRYIGIIFIPIVIIYILIKYFKNINKMFLYLSGFLTLSCFPAGIWIIRNYYMTHTILGVRVSSASAFYNNIHLSYLTIVNWFAPKGIDNFFINLIIAILGFEILWAFITGLKKQKTVTIKFIPILTYVIIYVAFMIYSSTTTAIDSIGDRFLSPIYVPITFLIFFLFAFFVQNQKNNLVNKVCSTFLLFIFFASFVQTVNSSMIFAENFYKSGKGYSSLSWRTSETIEFVNQNKNLFLKKRIYSDDPWALIYLANINADLSPKKNYYASDQVANTIASLKNSWPNEDESYLIWFSIKPYYLFDVDELKNIVKIETIKTLKDGAVYKIEKLRD
ncbi:MAG: ArnT family glycosyltransferase [Bacteroidales bacterium]